MKLSTLAILLMLCLSVACGKKGNSNGKRVTRITIEQINALMINQRFECASINGGRCPEGIARLLILDMNNADNSSVCSGFMVGPDTLVTNQHCVPDMKACKNTYIAIYNGYWYEQSKCSSILKVMNDYSNPNNARKKLDVSVLKLTTKFSGRAFKPAATKPAINEAVTAWVIDHTGLDKETPNLVDSRITEFACSVADQNQYQSLMLNKCPVIHGNSGSPAVNDKGEIIGVIWGATAGHLDSSVNLEERRNMSEEAAVSEVEHFKSYFNL